MEVMFEAEMIQVYKLKNQLKYFRRIELIWGELFYFEGNSHPRTEIEKKFNSRMKVLFLKRNFDSRLSQNSILEGKFHSRMEFAF